MHHFWGKKRHINGLIFRQKPKNLNLEEFWGFLPKMRNFLKNSAVSVFAKDPLTSYEISEKSFEPFLRKSVNLRGWGSKENIC